MPPSIKINNRQHTHSLELRKDVKKTTIKVYFTSLKTRKGHYSSSSSSKAPIDINYSTTIYTAYTVTSPLNFKSLELNPTSTAMPLLGSLHV